MITKTDIERLYKWATNTHFPLKKEGITSKYMGYEIHICYLKYGKKKTFYPHKSISKSIIDIIDTPEIFSLSYIQYPSKLEAKPHTDYNPYGKKFNRIQIPLKIPKGRKSYIEWIDSNERIYWEVGRPEIFDVEKLHKGANDSNEKMTFLYIDIDPKLEVEI